MMEIVSLFKERDTRDELGLRWVEVTLCRGNLNPLDGKAVREADPDCTLVTKFGKIVVPIHHVPEKRPALSTTDVMSPGDREETVLNFGDWAF
jgi:hypothetical protein